MPEGAKIEKQETPKVIWIETKDWGSGDAMERIKILPVGQAPERSYTDKDYASGSIHEVRLYSSEDGGKTWQEKRGLPLAAGVDVDEINSKILTRKFEEYKRDHEEQVEL